MHDIGVNTFGTGIFQRDSRIAERTGGINNIVHQNTILAFNFTDDVHHFGHARFFTAFVDDGQIRVQLFCHSAGADNAANIRGYHHGFFGRKKFFHVREENRRDVQIVGRDIEEPLNLACVQFQRQNTVGPRRRNHIGHQLGGDRRPSTGFAILARIAEIRQHRRDPPCGTAFQRIDRNQQFHQVVVRGIGRGLHHKHIFAADVFKNFDKNLHIGEATDAGLGHGNAQIGRNGVGKRAIGVTTDDNHLIFQKIIVLLGRTIEKQAGQKQPDSNP